MRVVLAALCVSAILAGVIADGNTRQHVRVDTAHRAAPSTPKGGNGDADLVTNLPGLPANYTSKMYAGYIDVNPESGRNLFYWFVESQNDPANAPVVLWLNGGPGCSSMTGFLTENGPFSPEADGNLKLNPSSWNTVANVVYLDSPSGVGFSYSTNTSDYKVGDKRTADDAYVFLVKFLNEWFPQYANSKFWVTGESYGGHYVPNLAKRIVEGNQAGGNPKINLQGFMVGNAWTDAAIDNKGAVFDWFSHALISEDTYNNIDNTCDFSKIGPLSLDACTTYTNDATTEMGKINIYQIYENLCTSSADGQHLLETLAKSPSKFSTIAKHLASNAASAAESWPNDPATGQSSEPPCVGKWFLSYLNKPEVQQALHAKPMNYYQCSPVVQYSYQDLLSSMLPVYQFLFQQNLRLLVYSGDVDGIVPTPGTRAWMKQLNLSIKNKWRPWMVNEQVGGYVEEYEQMTFSTIRGAGHMVPGVQPERALHFFKSFLDGTPF